MSTAETEERHDRIHLMSKQLRELCELEEGADTDEDSDSHRIVRWCLYRELRDRSDGWVEIHWLRAPFTDEEEGEEAKVVENE